MPNYDFRCPCCGRVEEWNISLSARPRMKNGEWPRHCNAMEMEKLPAAPAFTVAGFSAKNGYSKSS